MALRKTKMSDRARHWATPRPAILRPWSLALG